MSSLGVIGCINQKSIIYLLTFEEFIIKSIKVEIANIITPNKYILNVKPKISAEIPTIAGPNIAPTKAMLDT